MERKAFITSMTNILCDTSLRYKYRPVNIDTFYLPYHNQRDDKAILEQLCQSFSSSPAFKGLICKKANQNNADHTESLKVGIYFDNPQQEHSVYKLFAGIARALQASGIEVFIITSPSSSAVDSQELFSIVSGYIRISSNIKKSIEQIRSLELDVLIFTEHTASWAPYILSLSRLANVQVGTWGNPHTTGSDTIDYFLSSHLIEPIQADESYTERLIKLNKLPSVYPTPKTDNIRNIRPEKGLPLNQILIGIPQSLFKFHPDYDEILEEIISELPNAKFVLIEGKNKQQTDRLKSRWAANAPKTLESSIFLHRMSQVDYLCLLDSVDILLDPIYFGSGNTFYESMAIGTPLVTMPGDHMRGRIVSGGYMQMKLHNAPIAANKQEYIEITVRLAEDADARKTLKKEIRSAANNYLFNDQEAADEVIEFIRTAVDCRRKTGGLLPVNWVPCK